jgi:hypothetical protein
MMIELAEVIRELRSEVNRARVGARDDELQFELGPIDLEVTVAVEQEGGAGAKIRFWVVEIGGDARIATNNTQRIKLVLRPTLPEATAPIAQTPRVSVYVGDEEGAAERLPPS